MVLSGRETSRCGVLGSCIVSVGRGGSIRGHALLFHSGLLACRWVSQSYVFPLRMGCFLVIMSVVLIEDWFIVRFTLCKEEVFNWIAEKWRLSEYGSNIIRSCIVV